MKINNSYHYVLFVLLMGSHLLSAQDDDLFAILDKGAPKEPLYTEATFKAGRITFGPSVETRKKGSFEINLITKFWNIPNSDTEAFAADRVNTRFGVEYAFSDRLTGGIGVATFDGTFNAYGKYRLLRQREDGKSPLSITLLQSTSYLTRSFNHVILPEDSSERYSFTNQIILARKFDRNLSLQIAPTYVHRTSQQFRPDGDDNNHFAVGFGARYKLGRHVSIASEYYAIANRVTGIKGFSPFALGVNWDVKNLIMQFTLTNTRSFDESTTITLNAHNFNFNDGNLHIGTSFTYVLDFNKNKLKTNSPTN